MHQRTNSLPLPPTAPSSSCPNNNTPGHQGEQQVHPARWDAELRFSRGYTKIEKYSVSPAPSKAPAHSSLHIRSLRHTRDTCTDGYGATVCQRWGGSSSARPSWRLSQRASRLLRKRALNRPHRQYHARYLRETSFQEYSLAARAHARQNRGQKRMRRTHTIPVQAMPLATRAEICAIVSLT